MKNVKLMLASFLITIGLNSFGQAQEKAVQPKLIAVVNSAKWCAVCKANGQRFGAVLMSYADKGVSIYMNDLTDESTKATSKNILEKENVYQAVNTIPRKGMGKALKACGMIKDKKQTQDVAGIVTFIDSKTHKQIKQLSIAETDEIMQKEINQLLN